MTQKLSNDERQDEQSWEQTVARYLETHPDYFLHHPDVLAGLRLAHETGGRAVSLIERQVQVLREHNERLAHQLHELVANARENDVLGARLHRFALAMADAPAPEDALEAAYELLRQDFRLDRVAVRIRSETGRGRPEYAAPDDARLNALLERLAVGRPLCGMPAEESLLGYLFEGHAAELRSCALIPLGGAGPQGVLALASHDPQRFHSGMGTVYLARLGEFLWHGLRRR